jgi:hypothetical protein
LAVALSVVVPGASARSASSVAGGRGMSRVATASARADLTGPRSLAMNRRRAGIPSGLMAAARGPMREFWLTKLQEDYGITAGKDLSEQSLMELDNYLYWVQKLKRDYDVTVLPGQYTGRELRDIDSRLYWCKKIRQDYGIALDWRALTTAELVQRDAREARSRKLVSAD